MTGTATTHPEGSRPGPLVATSLKMYLSAAATRRWVQDVEAIVRDRAGHCPEVAVLPTFPLIESTAEALHDSPVAWGAQDIAPGEEGAQTGEVSGAVLAELGCRYVELAHAERRALFGEDEQMIEDKLTHALDNGLVPIYCVGEADRMPAEDAATHCVEELRPVLAATREAGSQLVVAYEPVWAIGAAEPAPAEHVRTVCAAIRDMAGDQGDVRVIYGGSAGPGTFLRLHPDVDGLFLGRFAHDTHNLAAVLDEVMSAPETARTH